MKIVKVPRWRMILRSNAVGWLLCRVGLHDMRQRGEHMACVRFDCDDSKTWRERRGYEPRTAVDTSKNIGVSG